MNVYPLEFHLGPLHVTGFGLMMMASFLVAAWLVSLELRRHQLDDTFAGDAMFGAVVGGIVGAKLWYVALTGSSPFSTGGFVWYGGFLGGVVGVWIATLLKGVPARWTMHLVAPTLAAGYAIGRVGCFLVGDDYGRPTSLPWAVRFPRGMPPSTAANLQEFKVAIPAGTPPDTVLAVHPTQLYEVAIMLAVFAWMWPRRKRTDWGTGALFGIYLMCAGVERFVVEIFRAKDDRLFGPLTVAQVTSVLLVLVGAALFAQLKGAGAVEPGRYLRGEK
ncbi:MAG: prolipoprotein diacylglyceryl transferase [Gemmatimonadales bacterium]|jgi:phosphatidylglycerol:prolipoprotein diacylglycerol transferase|nr:prolipoprotein diacylglyceryl transferase [Gemmatimonadales bacterium]